LFGRDTQQSWSEEEGKKGPAYKAMLANMKAEGVGKE